MLTENNIVDILSTYLEKVGYDILQKLWTGQKGVDIIARREGQKLFIEAKGETSSKSYTNRFGKLFTKIKLNHTFPEQYCHQ